MRASKWIAAGARWQKGSGAVDRLTLTPGEYALIKPGKRGQVRPKPPLPAIDPAAPPCPLPAAPAAPALPVDASGPGI